MDSFRRELMATYKNHVEAWKLDLALSRIAQMGFPEHEWPEHLQNAVMAMMDVTYDPSHPSGASEFTVLYRVVSNCLMDALRRKYRQKDQCLSLEAYVDQQGDIVRRDPGRAELRRDILRAVACLPERDRMICEGLLRGESRAAIAHRLRCGWHTVHGALPRIRAHFQKLGFPEWIGGRP